MPRIKSYLFTFSCLVGFVTGPTFCAIDQQTSHEIKTKTRDLDKIKQELSQKKNEKERLKKEEEALSHSIETNSHKIHDVEETLLYTRKKNNDVALDMATAKNKRDRYSTEIKSSRQELIQSAHAYYVAMALTGETSPTSALLRQIITQRTSTLHTVQSDHEKEGSRYANLSDTYYLIQNELNNQEKNLAGIRSLTKDKEKERQKKMTARESLEEELNALEKTKSEMTSLIETLRTKAKEDEELAKMERRKNAAVGQAPIQSHSLPWPMTGEVVKKFGRQKEAQTGLSFISNGIIIDGQNKSDVRAVADGHVLYAGIFMSYGPMTIVEHPGDWYTVYGLLSEWKVEKGQEVKKGDVLGTSGINEQGKHEMYFEIRFYGKPSDPLPWLGEP